MKGECILERNCCGILSIVHRKQVETCQEHLAWLEWGLRERHGILAQLMMFLPPTYRFHQRLKE